MLSDRQAFQELLLKDPSDHNWSVYADWLEEHGRQDGDEMYAEVIRLTLKLRNRVCYAFMYSCGELGYKECRCPDWGAYEAMRLRRQELVDKLHMIGRLVLITQ